MPSADLRTEFCGIEFDHPLVNGSGTLDALAAGTLGLAAFVTKTVTLHPREGNPPPRIAETPAGMVNSIGLANPGLDRFCSDHLPRLADLGVPVIVSVGGWSPAEYATAVARVGAHPCVVAIELNVSCPNVETGCISIGTDPLETRSLVERCRAETDLPVLAKLSPSVSDVAAIATAAAEGGAHGLVLINTRAGNRHRPRPPAAAPGRGRRRPLRTGREARRAARRLPRAGGHRPSDRRHGGSRDGAGLHRVCCSRRNHGRNWHLPVRGPGPAPTSASGAPGVAPPAWRGGIGELVGVAHPPVSSSTRA